MTIARNIVISMGLVALWLVGIFSLFTWPAWADFTVSFGNSYLATFDNSLRQFFWIAIPYSIGGFLIGVLAAIFVTSDRPTWWASGCGITMTAVLLWNALDAWFFSQSVIYQTIEFVVALLPIAFCVIGAYLGGRIRRVTPT
jgi:hypothetical protein